MLTFLGLFLGATIGGVIFTTLCLLLHNALCVCPEDCGWCQDIRCR